VFCEGEGVGEEDGLGEGEGVGVVGGRVGGRGGPSCAFANGAIATIETNMLRINSARITLAKFSFKPTGDFSNMRLSQHTNDSLVDLTLCQVLHPETSRFENRVFEYLPLIARAMYILLLKSQIIQHHPVQ